MEKGFDALDGPRAKVKRARGQLIALQKDSERFFAKNPHIIVADEFDEKGGNYPIVVKRCPSELPEEWSVIVGEIAHNLRSALNLLAWQLALLETPNPCNETAFPIFHIGKSGMKGKGSFWGKKGIGPACLKDVSRKYWARIEAFQPYKGGHGYRRSPLYRLRALNNTDKHRLSPILFSYVSSTQITGFFGGGSKIKIGARIRPNAKIGWINPLPFAMPVLHSDGARFEIRMQEETKVKFNVSSSLKFGDACPAVKNLAIFRTFYDISNEVSRIIESFASDF